MVSDNLNFTISAEDIGASTTVQRLVSNLTSLGAVGQASFLKLSTAGQNAQLKFVQLAVAVHTTNDAFLKAASATDVNTVTLEKAAAAALLARNNFETYAAQLESSNQTIARTAETERVLTASLAEANAALAEAQSAAVMSTNGYNQFAAALQFAKDQEISLLTTQRDLIAAQIELSHSANATSTTLERSAIAFDLNEQQAIQYAAAMSGPVAAAQERFIVNQKFLNDSLVSSEAAFTINEMQAIQYAASKPISIAAGSIGKLGDKLDDLGYRLESFGTRARQQGMNISMGIGLPIAAIGGLSIIAATQFETAMAQIQSQTGGTAAEVKLMTSAMLELASTSSQTPTALGESLFYIESVGIRGTKAIETMKAATMGAVAGQADLTEVTKALAAAMVSEVDGTTNAMTTMGTLNAIVEHGRLNMDDLASAMSTGVLAASKNFGVSLTDMGAALVVLTNSGVEANSAATRLRMTFSLLSAPTAKAANILKDIGLGALDIAHAIRDGGLASGLQLLKDKLDAFTDDPSMKANLLSQAFGGGRSSTTLITLLNQLDQVKVATKEVSRDSTRLISDYANMTETFGFKWKSFVANIQVDAIKLGDSMKPMAGALFGILPIIDQIASSFADLPAPIKDSLLALAGIALLSGPFLIFVGAIATMIGWIISGPIAIAKFAVSFINLARAIGIANASMMAFGSTTSIVIASIAVVAAAIIGLDIILRQTTGSGLLAWLSGAVQRNEAAAAATLKYGDALKTVQGLQRAGVELDKANSIVFDQQKKNIEAAANAFKGLKPPESSGWADWAKALTDVAGIATAARGVDEFKKIFSTSDWEKASAGANRLAQNFSTLNLSYRQLQSLIKDDNGKVTSFGKELLKNKDFSDQVNLTTAAFKASEEVAAEWTNTVITGSNAASQAKIDETFAWEEATKATDAYAKAVKDASDAFTPNAQTDPKLAAMELIKAKMEQQKLELSGPGLWTDQMEKGLKDITAAIAGYDSEFAVMSAEFTAFGANYISWTKSLTNVSPTQITETMENVQDLNVAMHELPPEIRTQVLAELPYLQFDTLREFFTLWNGRPLDIPITLSQIDNDVARVRTLIAGLLNMKGDIPIGIAFEAAAAGVPVFKGQEGKAEGGLISHHQFIEVGENDKPELILPLTKPDRMRSLLNSVGLLRGSFDGGGATDTGGIQSKYYTPGAGGAGGAGGGDSLLALKAMLDAAGMSVAEFTAAIELLKEQVKTGDATFKLEVDMYKWRNDAANQMTAALEIETDAVNKKRTILEAQHRAEIDYYKMKAGLSEKDQATFSRQAFALIKLNQIAEQAGVTLSGPLVNALKNVNDFSIDMMKQIGSELSAQSVRLQDIANAIGKAAYGSYVNSFKVGVNPDHPEFGQGSGFALTTDISSRDPNVLHGQFLEAISLLTEAGASVSDLANFTKQWNDSITVALPNVVQLAVLRDEGAVADAQAAEKAKLLGDATEKIGNSFSVAAQKAIAAAMNLVQLAASQFRKDPVAFKKWTDATAGMIAPKAAMGGIVDGSTFMEVGEAGRELILPLTKPDRVRELLKQNGMFYGSFASGGIVEPGMSPNPDMPSNYDAFGRFIGFDLHKVISPLYWAQKMKSAQEAFSFELQKSGGKMNAALKKAFIELMGSGRDDRIKDPENPKWNLPNMQPLWNTYSGWLGLYRSSLARSGEEAPHYDWSYNPSSNARDDYSPHPNSRVRYPHFDRGGLVKETGPAIVHKGEEVLTAEQRKSRGGVTVNNFGHVSVTAQRTDQFARELSGALR